MLPKKIAKKIEKTFATAIVRQIYSNITKNAAKFDNFFVENIDKFVLRVLNRFAHDHEIFFSFIAKFLFGLPEYYTFKKI